MPGMGGMWFWGREKRVARRFAFCRLEGNVTVIILKRDREKTDDIP